MSVTKNKSAMAIGFASVALLGLSACSSDDADTTTTDDAATTMEEMTSEAMSSDEETTSMESGMADPAANLVGPGCADYAETVPDGAGSVSGMAADPVATAASNNPLLTTLTAAVSGQLNPDVNLVDTLNGDEFTVFAPTDDAFAKLDAATLETLSTDSELLTQILTYHVVPGQIAPADIDGEQTTVEGQAVNVSADGDNIVINDNSNVVCGGVQTANATVYLIDTVLMPPA